MADNNPLSHYFFFFFFFLSGVVHTDFALTIANVIKCCLSNNIEGSLHFSISTKYKAYMGVHDMQLKSLRAFNMHEDRKQLQTEHQLRNCVVQLLEVRLPFVS